MQLNGENVVDTKSVLPYYQKYGLSQELLRKCSAQEFRYIDGVGMGYFLMTEDINDDTVSFEWDLRTVDLHVVKKFDLERRGFTGPKKLYVYVTAEPKYIFENTVVNRNFNVTIDKSLVVDGGATIVVLDPDRNNPKTVDQIITEILPSGYNVVYTAPQILPYDVNIEGINVREAIDTLCSTYGLIWTLDGSTVRIWGGQGNFNSTLVDPYNDIRTNFVNPAYDVINVVFPIYDYCRKGPRERYVYSQDNDGQGETLNVFEPYYPCVVDASDNPQNSSVLDTRGALIVQNLRALDDLEEYVAVHKAVCPPLSQTPGSLSEIHGDFGAGPRSIFREIPYPFRKVPEPDCDARLADNWIGRLVDGFYGSNVPSFAVAPQYGLDGAPPPGIQTVINLYSWEYGAPNWTVRVEWDCTNSRWIPLQMTLGCPPEEDPEYPPETPGGDPYYPPDE